MGDATPTGEYLARLRDALRLCGLEAECEESSLVAKNPVLVSMTPHGAMLSPGLTQKVEINEVQGKGLWWCWFWPADRPSERGAKASVPEHEPMCPAENINEATRRIVAVLRLNDNGMSMEPTNA